MDIVERNKRVEDNLKLVSHCLTLLKVQWSEDYFQQGVLELIRCVDNYDETKGYKFSTYAVKCITLKLKDYIKRDFVLKPKLTGEKGGKVWAPPVTSLEEVVYNDYCEKPIQLQDMIPSEDNYEALYLKMELESLVRKGIVAQTDLQIFLDFNVNGYTYRDLSKMYNMKNNEVKEKVSEVKELLQNNLSYNYYEGGQ